MGTIRPYRLVGCSLSCYTPTVIQPLFSLNSSSLCMHVYQLQHADIASAAIFILSVISCLLMHTIVKNVLVDHVFRLIFSESLRTPLGLILILRHEEKIRLLEYMFLMKQRWFG